MEYISSIIQYFSEIKLETIIDILIGIMIIIIFNLFSSFFSYLVIKLFNMKKKKDKIKKNIFYKPLRIFFIITGVYLAAYVLKLPENVMGIVNKGYRIITICLAANGFANIANVSSEFSIKLQEKLRFNGDNTVANFIGKIIKAIVYIIAGFLVVSELGYDLSGLITGLGLGGVVVAFAAQDIAKNLFGGVTILFDKPFVVGDWIELGTYSGTVEDISFRSTKIRTADDTVITIPNSIISNESIINWNRISKRRYAFNLSFHKNTPIEIVKQITQKIELVLKSNPNIEPDTVEVHIDQITECAINVFISVYTQVTAYYDYLAVKETVNCSIMDLLEKEEISLAYPTQTVEINRS